MLHWSSSRARFLPGIQEMLKEVLEEGHVKDQDYDIVRGTTTQLRSIVIIIPLATQAG